MPVRRYIFGRDKPGLTALLHGGAAPLERRRALGLQHLLQPRLLHAEEIPSLQSARRASVPFWRRATWRVLSVVLPIAAVAVALAVGGFADCRASPALLRFGAQVDAGMSVNAGWPCVLLLKTPAPSIEVLDILVPPQRGRVTVRGRTGVTYQADQNFQGTDTFALVARTAPSARLSPATVRVQVHVK
jgi:hypothetical protein